MEEKTEVVTGSRMAPALALLCRLLALAGGRGISGVLRPLNMCAGVGVVGLVQYDWPLARYWFAP